LQGAQWGRVPRPCQIGGLFCVGFNSPSRLQSLFQREEPSAADSDADQVADLLEAEEELITSRPRGVTASPHAHSACSVLFRGDEVKHQPTRPLRSTNWSIGATPRTLLDETSRQLQARACSCSAPELNVCHQPANPRPAHHQRFGCCRCRSQTAA